MPYYNLKITNNINKFMRIFIEMNFTIFQNKHKLINILIRPKSIRLSVYLSSVIHFFKIYNIENMKERD